MILEYLTTGKNYSSIIYTWSVTMRSTCLEIPTNLNWILSLPAVSQRQGGNKWTMMHVTILWAYMRELYSKLNSLWQVMRLLQILWHEHASFYTNTLLNSYILSHSCTVMDNTNYNRQNNILSNRRSEFRHTRNHITLAIESKNRVKRIGLLKNHTLITSLSPLC